MISRRQFMKLGAQSAAALALAPMWMRAQASGSAQGDFTKFVQIKAPCGSLRGVGNARVSRFLGVPFAKPPVGALRFKAAQPIQAWSGVRDALQYARAPIQKALGPKDYFPYDPGYSEDCLYLNIWAPTSPGPHPVFVWIHGGGNVAGTTSMAVFDGEQFARDGVVLVSIAYRVGALGFLDVSGWLGDDYAGSGNNGLLDQVQALKWVRENIAAFGGDPGLVTIGGQSAGAKNVISLMASVHAKGLFHGAISQSGGGQTCASKTVADELCQRFVVASGLNTDQKSEFLALPAERLLDLQNKVGASYLRKYPFRAVLDGVVLQRSPLEDLAAGASQGIPLMIGTCRDEQAFFGPTPDGKGQIVPNRDLANAELSEFDALHEEYRARYPSLSADDLRYRSLTAESYWIPSVRVAEARAARSAATYLFRFDMVPQAGSHKGYSVHGSELALMFDNMLDPTAPSLGPTGPAADRLASTMHKSWIDFMHGHTHLRAGKLAWPTYSLARRECMVFDDPVKVVSDLDAADRKLWQAWMPVV